MENQENEELTLMPLGEDIQPDNREQENPEYTETEDYGYFGKPDYYDYSKVELPEDYCYDEQLLNEFNELAAKYNLSQKGADELMAMAVKLTKLTSDNYSKTIAEQQRQKIDDYRHALVNDRSFGGGNFARTMQTANTAYDTFTDEDVRKLLSETGLNCHPKIVKMFWKIGRSMQNDSLYGVNSAPFVKENPEDILYPTMQ